MGLNKPFTRLHVLNPSTPMTSGGTRNLGDGQIGLFTQVAGANGAIATASIVNKKNEKYFFEVGQGYQSNDGGFTTRGHRSTAFSASDVEDLSFNESLSPTLAQVYLGFDGKDASKSISLKKGASAEITLKLTGLPLAYYGFSQGIYESGFTISADSLADCEDDCTEASMRTIVLNLIKEIKNRNIRSGVKLSDVIDIHPVFSVSPNAAATGTVKFYTLVVKDAGDSQALGLVDAQYAGKVTRVSYLNGKSVYQIVAASLPTAFASWEAPILTDCGAECPDGYTATDAGFLYTISLDTAAGIEAALEGKAYIDVAVKTGQEYGVDKWSILCPVVLSAANISDLISTYGTVQIDGAFEEVTSVCVIDEAPTTAWVLDETCNVSTKSYFIELDDTLCGDSRHAELKATFPDNTIYQLGGVTTVTTPVAGTFTDGTYTAVSGTSDGIGTGATFTVVVTGSSSAAITVVAAGDGYEVGDTITILDAVLGDGGADDLEIVIASITDASAGECRQRYYTDVITSAVCDECHPDIYVSEAPNPFEFEMWQEVPATALEEEGSVGIMFRSKKLDLCPPKHFADKIGMINNIVEIQVSGGWLLGTKIGYKYNTAGEFAQTRVSRAFDGTGWGRDYLHAEQLTAEYATSILGTKDEAEKWFKNIQSKLEPCAQYDTISLKLNRTVSAQGFSKEISEKFRHIFVIPRGSKYLYESFFNLIASANNNVSNI
jgi:hypothetical protein